MLDFFSVFEFLMVEVIGEILMYLQKAPREYRIVTEPNPKHVLIN